MAKIKKIIAREILNSRGEPNLETMVILEDESFGRFAPPAGPKKTDWHPQVKRDDKKERFSGKGVLENLEIIKNTIAPKIVGLDSSQQEKIDQVLEEMDNSPKKERTGVDTLLSVSVANLKAAAQSLKITPYLHLANLLGEKNPSFYIPPPMVDIISGGTHGYDNVDFSEYMIASSSAKSYSSSLAMAVEVYLTVRKKLLERHITIAVSEGGALSPQFFTNSDPLVILVESINSTSYQLGKDLFLTLDIGATHFKKGGGYKIRDLTQILKTEDIIDYFQKLIEKFRLLAIEDPLDENNWDGWTQINSAIGANTLVVADDLVSGNLERLNKLINQKGAGGVVFKIDQVPTVSQGLKFIQTAKKGGLKIIVSHRSVDTNDDFIADWAVGTGVDYVKFGPPQRGENVAKYNRLLLIENQIP